MSTITFFFSIALAILMADVQSYMDERYLQAVHDQSSSEIVYTDDILFIHRDVSIAQLHIDYILRIGKLMLNANSLILFTIQAKRPHTRPRA